MPDENNSNYANKHEKIFELLKDLSIDRDILIRDSLKDMRDSSAETIKIIGG